MATKTEPNTIQNAVPAVTPKSAPNSTSNSASNSTSSTAANTALTPNQQVLQVLPKILAAAAALGMGGRLAIAAGGMAPKSLTDVSQSKSVLFMPDVNLLSQAEQERRIEEQRILEREWKRLQQSKIGEYDSPCLAHYLEYAAKAVHDVLHSKRIKQAALPLSRYLPEIIGGGALSGGGLFFANAPEKKEDSLVARVVNTPSWVVPRTSDILNTGTTALPRDGSFDSSVAAAIEGASNEAKHAADPLGTFAGKYAKSLRQVPWMYPTVATLGSISLLGGYKLTDAIIKRRAERKREIALAKARKQFEDALLLEQEMGKGTKKTASVLDEFCDEVERQPEFQKQLQLSSHNKPQQKTAALLDYYLAALGTTAALGGLFGLSTGYGAASRTERLAALQRARELQLARRREDETRVKLIAPAELTSLFPEENLENTENAENTEPEENKSLQSELNAGKTGSIDFSNMKFGSMGNVPDWNFEKTAGRDLTTLLWLATKMGGKAMYRTPAFLKRILSKAPSKAQTGQPAEIPAEIPTKTLTQKLQDMGGAAKGWGVWGLRNAVPAGGIAELGGAATGWNSIRPTNILKNNIYDPHIVGNNPDPRYTRHKEWVSPAHNRELAKRDWFERIQHMANTAVLRGNINEYLPTYTFKKLKVSPKPTVKAQTLNPDAVMFADPSTALRRATAGSLSGYNDDYSNKSQRVYY
jgi:hypothetical protein